MAGRSAASAIRACTSLHRVYKYWQKSVQKSQPSTSTARIHQSAGRRGPLVRALLVARCRSDGGGFLRLRLRTLHSVTKWHPGARRGPKSTAAREHPLPTRPAVRRTRPAKRLGAPDGRREWKVQRWGTTRPGSRWGRPEPGSPEPEPRPQGPEQPVPGGPERERPQPGPERRERGPERRERPRPEPERRERGRERPEPEPRPAGPRPWGPRAQLRPWAPRPGPRPSERPPS